MKSEPVIAIAGATGLVGREMIKCIMDLELPFSDIRLLASERSEGELIDIGEDQVSVDVLGGDSFKGVDIALFATGSELSREYVPLAAEAGAVAIDNSSCFRMEEDIPLVIPEVNPEAVSSEDRIIANPNCSTIQLVLVLNILEKAAGLERVVVSTYQSVSGAGKEALDELWEQSIAIFNQSVIRVSQFAHQIAFNCIPQIDTVLEDGYTKEELKVINESRKILNLPDLKITATAVRVPVFHSHAESVNVSLKKNLSPSEFYALAEKTPGIELFQANDVYPMQISAAGGDTVQVGRVRRDDSVENGLNLWIVSDNLRKGAALNAVQTAKLLLDK